MRTRPGLTTPRRAGTGRGSGRWPAAAAILGALTVATSCSAPLGKLGDVATDEDPPLDLPPVADRTLVLQLDDGAVDILFVIDNSGSMGEEQANLSPQIARFVADAVEVHGGDIRVAFTTTDNGNPWCQGTDPEAGKLRLSACTQRLSDFVFEGAQTIDVTGVACTALCGLDTVGTTATTTHLDAAAASRPWIEASSAGTNLVDAALEEAVLCAAPQGIDGCGFESPLEALSKAISRAESPSDRAHGFLRPWARLAVVFVTDEADCSVDSAWEEIFLPDGNRVFWSDSAAPAPTSAVCWNAGVECEGTGTDIGPCHPQNFDVEGRVTDAASAVMTSLTRYIEQLEAVEASKAAYHPDHAVALALVAGVPVGYGDGAAELHYTRGAAGNPQFVRDFGVDPGCSSAMGTAVPPVRMRALAELFPSIQREVVFSVCRDDLAPAFDVWQEDLLEPHTERSACVPGCLADVDDGATGTQVDCEIIMTWGTESGREQALLPTCDDADAGEDACYRLRLDAQASECAAQGSNAQLELVLPESFVVRGQVRVEAACEGAPAC